MYQLVSLLMTVGFFVGFCRHKKSRRDNLVFFFASLLILTAAGYLALLRTGGGEIVMVVVLVGPAAAGIGLVMVFAGRFVAKRTGSMRWLWLMLAVGAALSPFAWVLFDDWRVSREFKLGEAIVSEFNGKDFEGALATCRRSLGVGDGRVACLAGVAGRSIDPSQPTCIDQIRKLAGMIPPSCWHLWTAQKNQQDCYRRWKYEPVQIPFNYSKE